MPTPPPVVVQVSDGSLIQRRSLCGGSFVALPPRDVCGAGNRAGDSVEAAGLCTEHVNVTSGAKSSIHDLSRI